MYRFFLTLLCVLCIQAQLRSQYFHTSASNDFNEFTYFEYGVKANTGIAIAIVNEQALYGLNGVAGINFNYYFHPVLALHAGLELEQIIAMKNISEQGFVFNNNKLESFTNKYQYRFNALNIKTPIGVVLNLTNHDKGFLIGTGLYLRTYLNGNLSIKENSEYLYNYKAFEYDFANKIYSNNFKRFGVQYYLNTAIQLDKHKSWGLEIAIDLTDILNNKPFSSYNHSIGVFFNYRFAKNN